MAGDFLFVGRGRAARGGIRGWVWRGARRIETPWSSGFETAVLPLASGIAPAQAVMIRTPSIREISVRSSS